jgi:uncharacterized protein
MHDELRALAKLAKMDGSASDHEAELRDLPARIEGMRSDLQMLETLLAAERGQIDDATTLRDERAADLKARVNALSEAKGKLSKARTLREADSAEREVEHSRRAIKEREEEVLSIEETIEQKTASLSEREKQLVEAQAMLRDEETAAEARLKIVRVERDAVLAGREEVVQKLPKRVVKRYEKLRTRPRYDAVSFIGADGTCHSCRMALPPQLFIEVQRGDELHECPQCRAFLVHEAFVPDVPAGPRPESAPTSAPEETASAD